VKLIFALLLLPFVAACSGHVSTNAVDKVPLTVGEVTYQWPTDGTTDFGDLGQPKNWKGVAYIPEGVWNNTMAKVPGMHRTGWKGQIALQVIPARVSQWDIEPQGEGLPLFPSEHFYVTEKGNGFTVGRVRGGGIVDPSVLVTFDGERQAYAVCRTPSGANPTGTCNLLINDRGIEHTIPLGWENWTNAKEVLSLYRSMVGIPKPVGG
jgi:hypothetical protein